MIKLNAVCSMIDYWNHNVICLSICLSVMLCIVWLNIHLAGQNEFNFFCLITTTKLFHFWLLVVAYVYTL